jgi:Virulence factor
MARWEIVAWRDIPAAVEATDDGGQVTLQLSERFQALIDSVAMQQGLEASDAYLEQWQKLPGGERPGTAREVGAAVVDEIEARFMDYIGRAFRRP